MKIMENGRARGGKAAARALRPEGRIDGRLSAGASLDCLYALLGTTALYYWFGELHRHGAPSRALAATLLFSPLIAGIALARRGHVLPILINVQWGIVSAIAAIVPLLGLRSGDVQRLSWNGVGRVLFMLAFIGLVAGLCSLAGGELGGLIHRLHQRKAMYQGAVARARSWPRIRSSEWSGPGVPVAVALIAAGATILAAVIAKL